jgi:hypothetical protein
MDAERTALDAFERIKTYVVQENGKHVRVNVADYRTAEDFEFFKSGQDWAVYNRASDELQRLCGEAGFLFDNSIVVKRSVFEEFAQQHGLNGGFTDRINFVLESLGCKRRDGIETDAYGISPFVVMTSDNPEFSPQTTLVGGHIIAN